MRRTEPSPQPLWEQFEAYVAQVMAVERVPAVSVAFARDGEIVYARGFGWQDRERGISADAATVYGVASVTKSFTAACILQLEEAGKLSVTDPVRRHLPGFRVSDPGATERITIHHLLSHTSGLPPLPVRRGGQLMAHPQRPARPIPQTVADLLAYLAEEPYELLAPPGETFSYSNEGYALLGAIIERVSGEPFASYVERHILDPLGMGRSSADAAVVAGFPSVAQLYVRPEDNPDEVVADPGWPEWGPYMASGALRSNVLDLVRYLSWHLSGGTADGRRLLAPERIRRMRTPVIEYLPGFHYAYGLQVRSLAQGATAVGHGGNQKGISAFAGYVPEHNVCGAVLANLQRVPCADLWEAGIRAMLGLSPAEAGEAGRALGAPPADVDWRAYTGVFASDEGMELRIRPAAGGPGLLAETEGVQVPVRWLGPDYFEIQVRARREPFQFLRNPDGTVGAVRYHLRVLRKIGEHR
ncbi:MAG: beta-lactamase family protein [Limnochordales bacterium]|nr:serine hydrolase domain-containing protein [Limnochordales bacterium]